MELMNETIQSFRRSYVIEAHYHHRFECFGIHKSIKID
jgi:hypothetical protein